MKKTVSALLASVLLLLPTATMIAAAASPAAATMQIIEAHPGNMVFLDVTDKDGNSIKGVTVTLCDAAGTKIAKVTNDKSAYCLPSSGLDCTELGRSYWFKLPWNQFTPKVAPQTLFRIEASYLEENFYHMYADSDYFNVPSHRALKYRLYSYDANEAVAQTLAANQFGVYVDPKWSKRTQEGFFTSPNGDIYFNKQKSSGNFQLIEGLKIYADTGKVTVFDAFDTSRQCYFGIVDSHSGSCISPSVKDTATQYVLCRLPLCQLSSHFDEYGNYVIDNVAIPLQKNTKQASAALVIQSGGMMSFAIPDEDGYVEFYLEKSTRQYGLNYKWSYNMNTTMKSSGFSAFGYAGNLTEGYIEPVPLPKDEIILTQVPVGTYTLQYDNIPKGYAAPEITAITVTDSKQIQHYPLILEDLFLLGDVNCDKLVNATDAAMVLKAASAVATGSPSELTQEQQKAADVNKLDSFNATDAALILQYAAYAGAGGKDSVEDFVKTL